MYKPGIWIHKHPKNKPPRELLDVLATFPAPGIPGRCALSLLSSFRARPVSAPAKTTEDAWTVSWSPCRAPLVGRCLVRRIHLITQKALSCRGWDWCPNYWGLIFHITETNITNICWRLYPLFSRVMWNITGHLPTLELCIVINMYKPSWQSGIITTCMKNHI